MKQFYSFVTTCEILIGVSMLFLIYQKNMFRLNAVIYLLMDYIKIILKWF